MFKLKAGSCILLPCVLLCQICIAQNVAKKKVTSQSDLPRFTYRMSMPASELLQGDAATFRAFADEVDADLTTILRDYDISDSSTLRGLLGIKADLQQLSGDDQGALKTVQDLRAMQDKPAAKLTARLRSEAELQAAVQTGSTSGPEYEQAFRRFYEEAVNKLPWDVVQDWAKAAWAQSKTLSRAGLIGMAKAELDPAVEKSKALSNDQAWDLVDIRTTLQFGIPEKDLLAQVLGKYVTAHNVARPDIWEAREVTLTGADKLTPVLVGIWDTGVDVSIFGKQVFSDPNPTESGNHGWAFDSQGYPTTGWLSPLSREQLAEYPNFREEIKARLDLENGVDSPEAQAFKKRMTTLTPDEMHQRAEMKKVLGFYLHGTHVAGIVARGNPAVRLVVARFDDQLPDLPFQPTPEWAHRMAAAFQKMSDYFRTRNVRVVNMSWGDDPKEIEVWLAKTGGPTDPAERKKRADEIFGIWHDAVENAIKGAPETLFVCAAGNSDSDASFLRDVPAGLRLPNLIAVGAVNQAGDETSFTSYGPTVVVDANGYQVDSFVPGGSRAKLSGTSMASPNVANLAAKLFALDPSLTPEKVIDLIRRGADASEDGRRHLINPEKSVELLRGAKAEAAAAR
jgi:subtilisin family serine protease